MFENISTNRRLPDVLIDELVETMNVALEVAKGLELCQLVTSRPQHNIAHPELAPSRTR